MAANYYLYLTEEAWVEPWERGGEVPINPASAYLSKTRSGTLTPDETVQRAVTGMPDWVVQGPLRVHPGASLHIENIGIVVREGPRTFIQKGFAEARVEDGLILSLSTILSRELAERLGKAACVKIRSVPRLIRALEAELSVNCKAGTVAYTSGYARNHFLKSSEDAWQQEYRLLWLSGDVRRRIVTLPAGMAKRVF